MAGTSRFHDKLHRANHHSAVTPGLPDSASDPIASSSAPFRGDFVLSGALSAIGDGEFDSLKARSNLLVQGASTALNSTLYVSGATTLRNNIYTNNAGVAVTTDSYPVVTNAGPGTLTFNFNKGVYINGTFGTAPKLVLGTPGIDAGIINVSNVAATSALLSNLTVSNSANIARMFASDAKVYSLSTYDGAYVGGRLGVGTTNPQYTVHIIGDTLIYGNLSANGTANFQNTTFTTTSALSIVNTGTGAALTVSQEGNQAVAAFYDHESTIGLWIDGDTSRPGWVGVKTKTPNVELTVQGDISASGQIYGSFSGSSIAGSSKWDSVYATVTGSSASWVSDYNTTNANSATWVSVYTSNLVNSAGWVSNYNTTVANSAAWGAGAGSAGSTYSTVNSNSALWSSNYTTTNANSALWVSDYTNSNANSGRWSSSYTTLNANSGTWNTTTTTVNNNAASWNSTASTVGTYAGSWNSTTSTVNSRSPLWDSNYTTTNANSASWSAGGGSGGSSYSTLNSNSAFWSSNYTTTNTNSASWGTGGSSYTTLNANSASWNSNYNTTQSNSALWSSNYTTTNANSSTWSLNALSSLGDVALLLPVSNGQVISYNNTTKTWVNTTPSAGVTQLSALSDVTVVSPTNNQLLVYSTATNKWVNSSTISTTSTLTAGNIDLTSASVATYATPLTASGDFLLVRLNGTVRKIQLWD